MKKGILLSSLVSLFTLAISGCSCGKDGTYTFAYIEYAEDGETKKVDCNDPQGTKANIYCPAIKQSQLDQWSITLDKDTFNVMVGDTEIIKDAKYKIVDGKFQLNYDDNDNYVETDLSYNNKTITLSDDLWTVVYKK